MANIRFDILEDITGGDPDMMRNLLETILKSLDTAPTQIRQALQAANHRQLRDHTHHFKSSVSYLQYADFSATLDLLERQSDAQAPVSSLAPLVERVDKLVVETRQVIQQKLASL